MLLDEESQPALMSWLSSTLALVYSYDQVSLLSNYVLKILKGVDSRDQIAQKCVEKLETFLERETQNFVQTLVDALSTSSNGHLVFTQPATPFRPVKAAQHTVLSSGGFNNRGSDYRKSRNHDDFGGSRSGHSGSHRSHRGGDSAHNGGGNNFRENFRENKGHRGHNNNNNPRYRENPAPEDLAFVDANNDTIVQVGGRDFGGRHQSSGGFRGPNHSGSHYPSQGHNFNPPPTSGFDPSGATITNRLDNALPVGPSHRGGATGHNNNYHPQNMGGRPKFFKNREGASSGFVPQTNLSGEGLLEQPKMSVSMGTGMGVGVGMGMSGEPYKASYDEESATTLLIAKIPAELNNPEALGSHFGKFGEIASIRERHPTPQSAFIDFASNQAATAAIRSTEAVLGNRFIKVLWANRSDDALKNRARDKGEGFAAKKFKGEASHKSSKENKGAVPKPTVIMPLEINSYTRPKPSLTEVQKQKILLRQKEIMMAKQLFEALEKATDPVVREELRKKIAVLTNRDKVDLELPKKEKGAASTSASEFEETIDVELELISEEDPAASQNLEKLQQKLDTVKNLAKQIGAVPSAPSTSSSSNLGVAHSTAVPKLGTKAAAASPYWKIDNRPTVLKLKDIPDVLQNTALLKAHFGKIAEVLSLSLSGNLALIKFVDPENAEKALKQASSLQGHTLNLSFYQTKQTPTEKTSAPNKPPASPPSSNTESSNNETKTGTNFEATEEFELYQNENPVEGHDDDEEDDEERWKR